MSQMQLKTYADVTRLKVKRMLADMSNSNFERIKLVKNDHFFSKKSTLEETVSKNTFYLVQ